MIGNILCTLFNWKYKTNTIFLKESQVQVEKEVNMTLNCNDKENEYKKCQEIDREANEEEMRLK